MKCDEVATADLPSRYLAGHLAGPEREAYEEHYFECDACFRELEVLRSAQAVLAEEAPSGLVQKADSRPRWLPIAAALAAASTLAVWWSSHQGAAPDLAKSHPNRPDASASAPTPGQTRAAELSQLARFEPPPYEPPRLRGGSPSDAAALDRAMSRYQGSDFAGAIPGLEEHLGRHSDDIRGAFFLGVSLLATDHADAAVRWFERVAAAGDSAFDEEAWYLLAKAHIKRVDLRAAIAALDRTIALKGERANEARALRERLLALEQQKK